MSGVNTWLWILAAVAASWAGAKAWRRIELSRAKHRSLEGHPRWAARLARWLPYYDYGGERFFAADGAPAGIATKRQQSFQALQALFRTRYARGQAMGKEASHILSDMQLTSRYRVPFQFSARVRESLVTSPFVQSTHGMSVVDVDGNEALDLTGSYGVNVFGNDFYKGCIERGSRAVQELGPVLGALHPVVLDNVRRLQALSGMDEISFHMSGTEAVMQAVRLARYHTRRRKIARFCGAYHGWWGEVQPGAGNPVPALDTYTLNDMSPAALRVLEHRRDIACVLVNPLQALHPNRNAPADSALFDGVRRAGFDREAYGRWLRTLREVCTRRGIALIMDEVFLGFRLAPGGAQEYFGVQADMVTYGKTVAGGLPIGVVAGKARWMRRYDPLRPANVCFARGTFNSHPYVMGAMNEFLRALEGPDLQSLYQGLDATWNERAASLNGRLAAANVPVRVRNLSTVWTIVYTEPSRYHWMFQYYLRAEGLALSWVGSGRLIFTLNCTAGEFAEVARRFEAAACAMKRDGWWWQAPGIDARSLRRKVLRELVKARLQARCSSSIGSSSSPRSR